MTTRITQTIVRFSAPFMLPGLDTAQPPGDYRVVAGLYDPLTNQRWRFADGQDGVELFQFALP